MTYSTRSEEYPAQSASSIGSGPSAQMGDHEEPTRKPKKVNSEARKQQNRIASRNYREKRKQKIHDLQRRVREESDEYQQSPGSPERFEPQVVPVAMDHATTVSHAPSYQSPFENDSLSEHSSSVALSNPSGSLSFSSPPYLPAQLYPTFGSSWNTPLYSPPPPAEMSWSIPQYPPELSRIHSHSHTPRHMHDVNAYEFVPPPPHPTFASSSITYQNPQHLPYSLDPNINIAAAFDSSNLLEQQHQTSDDPNVSLLTTNSTSSSYYDERLRRPY